MTRVTYDGEKQTNDYTKMECMGESVNITPDTHLLAIADEFQRKYGEDVEILLVKE